MTHLIERFTEHLKKGKYNSLSIAAYRNAIFVFYNQLRDIPQSKITDEIISDYLLELGQRKNVSIDAVKQSGKAIKLFYEIIFNRKLTIKISGEMKEPNLPLVLSRNEVKQLIGGLDNQKHKTLLTVIYAAGLRLSEVLNLKVANINFEKREIYIEPSTTETGRTIMLSEKLIPILHTYIEKYQPNDLLFMGEKGKAYSSRSVQLVLQVALKKANIKKEATVHSLRHSFAVHFLEQGLDIHYLQEILGHRYLQTTALYSQMVDIKITQLKSPFDN